jgi:uncharacterized membrane protein
MALLSGLYLAGIVYYVWAIATDHVVQMSRPGFTIGFGVFFALGVGLIVTKPFVPRLLAIILGLLMSLQAYMVLRRQREFPNSS